MTVSGSSNMMTLTSERTSPRPSEIFCLPSAVRPAARRSSIALADRACGRSRAPPASISARRHAAVAQREGQVVVDRHGVVDDRELEHLGDVAPVGRHVGHVDVVEQDPALGRAHQPGDDVEQRGLAAARRPEQRVGAAVRPLEVELLQRPVLGCARLRQVGVPDVLQGDPGHQRSKAHAAAVQAQLACRRRVMARSARRRRSKVHAALDVEVELRGRRRPRTACTPCDCETQVQRRMREVDDALRAAELGDLHLAVDRQRRPRPLRDRADVVRPDAERVAAVGQLAACRPWPASARVR